MYNFEEELLKLEEVFDYDPYTYISIDGIVINNFYKAKKAYSLNIIDWPLYEQLQHFYFSQKPLGSLIFDEFYNDRIIHISGFVINIEELGTGITITGSNIHINISNTLITMNGRHLSHIL